MTGLQVGDNGYLLSDVTSHYSYFRCYCYYCIIIIVIVNIYSLYWLRFFVRVIIFEIQMQNTLQMILAVLG